MGYSACEDLATRGRARGGGGGWGGGGGVEKRAWRGERKRERIRKGSEERGG